MSPTPAIVPPARTTVLEAVLKYAKRGLRVLPVNTIREDGTCSCGQPNCNTPGKHPCVPEWQERATIDPALLEVWFIGRWRGANVGIATGANSGIIVLDEDPRNGGDDCSRD